MWFERFRRRRRLDDAARRLGASLRQRYGSRRWYPPADVFSTAAMLGIGGMAIGYLLALYCSREDFADAAREVADPADYDRLRAEMGAGDGASGGWDVDRIAGAGGGIDDADADADGEGGGDAGGDGGGGSGGSDGGDGGGGDGGGD